ncbi:unnamed protein product (macronuclear) [Paramecium tetraurelia]|uniref:Chromosome undetermined scaffold_1, whole genome shotgun sequence n=1 Tax=Paramecium tetraurelia TaxID=5888 RepID=Q6BFL8_PARTE|nr:hypothetical protein [Paramecium tetraurelia strain d4-2]XP_001423102.1 uncharacterized protein GSPATT00000139001 [Paramecium tetraurelia]CAH03552.1 hypothetical protein PTMB.355 [Paramecium tetraurelia]CAK55704.1 unnamed protein product [Paramecium tetraurelia]|eukprot:XP_001423102.1 hypothetical protein (macronuclear) [Paramecium tetraurelia strain d4-2]
MKQVLMSIHNNDLVKRSQNESLNITQKNKEDYSQKMIDHSNIHHSSFFLQMEFCSLNSILKCQTRNYVDYLSEIFLEYLFLMSKVVQLITFLTGMAVIKVIQIVILILYEISYISKVEFLCVFQQRILANTILE